MPPTQREVKQSLELLGVMSGKLDLADCTALGKPSPSASKPKHHNTKNESRLVYEIMRELGRHGAVYRMNAGQIKLEDGRVFRGLPAGFSDIMLIMDGGRVCFVEAKIKPNKPTQKQIEFIERMRGLGCAAGVAYSVEEAAQICGIPIFEDGG